MTSPVRPSLGLVPVAPGVDGQLHPVDEEPEESDGWNQDQRDDSHHHERPAWGSPVEHAGIEDVLHVIKRPEDVVEDVVDQPKRHGCPDMQQSDRAGRGVLVQDNQNRVHDVHVGVEEAHGSALVEGREEDERHDGCHGCDDVSEEPGELEVPCQWAVWLRAWTRGLYTGPGSWLYTVFPAIEALVVRSARRLQLVHGFLPGSSVIVRERREA